MTDQIYEFTREITQLNSKIETLREENVALTSKHLKLIENNLETDFPANFDPSFDPEKQIKKAMKNINDTALYTHPSIGSSVSSANSLQSCLLNDSYEKSAKLEDLFKQQKSLQNRVLGECKLQTKLAGKYQSLYEKEKIMKNRLSEELHQAFSRIATLEDQVTGHARLHDEFVRELDKKEMKESLDRFRK